MLKTAPDINLLASSLINLLARPDTGCVGASGTGFYLFAADDRKSGRGVASRVSPGGALAGGRLHLPA